MDRDALVRKIIDSFPGLPAQLGVAARYIVDNPDDVALLSMREQARRAGVQPWTMSRLAKRLGYDGYEAIRALHANAIRQGELGFAGRAGRQAARQKESGETALARDIVAAGATQIGRLCAPDSLAALANAAALLASARRVYCLGLRSSHAIAAQFAYIMSFLGDRAVLLGTDGFGGLDAVRMAGADDALLAVSVSPYSRATLDIAHWAAGENVPVVAITDSPVSPLAAIARHAIFVSTESPSFFHSMAPAFVAAETLAALVAGRGGAEALAAIARAEQQLAAFGVHHLAPATRTGP
ncbi:SIS domain-containing protein [Nitratireductor sp. CAU 1489]|uniref:SIS domain-containing protein n=1 Tax=Nitratireductor arenosus TaxID=2682096 RepID=A0A844QGP2_9HYPH|nr:MurR/RpiR family transcriptional regulator [Nitratireductor arenosus]MVA98572.1 SIS domain-containing protein [Nitratireductor arenosus]